MTDIRTVLKLENDDLRSRIATLEAENARLTAANESMQEDAGQNTYAFGLMLKANKEQAEEIRTLKQELDSYKKRVKEMDKEANGDL